MALHVVNPQHWDTQGKPQRSCHGPSDHQSTHQTGPRGIGYTVDMLLTDARLLEHQL